MSHLSVINLKIGLLLGVLLNGINSVSDRIKDINDSILCQIPGLDPLMQIIQHIMTSKQL